MDAKTGDPLHGSPMEAGAALGPCSVAPIATGGRTSSRSKSCPSTERPATRMAMTSTMPRRSWSSTIKRVKRDLTALMTDSQPWWPADYGHYGRSSSAWHGTLRAPIAPATAAAARIRAISASLRSTLAGQRQSRQGAAAALAGQAEVRPQPQLGGPAHFRRQCRDRIDGRTDLRLRRRPQRHLRAGAGRLLGNRGKLGRQGRQDTDRREREAMENPLAAVQMGLIYVNPEGPDGNPDPFSRPATSA